MTLLSHRARALLLAPVLLGALLLSDTAAAQSGSGLVRVVAPAEGAPVLRATRVVIKVRRNARASVSLDGRRITDRFRRRKGRLVGRVRRSDIGIGPATLFVTARAGERSAARTVSLVGVRRSPRFVRLGLRRDRRSAGPVDMRLRFAGEPRHLRARLNGRSLEDLLEREQGHNRSLRLTRVHGLRFGANRLTVAAHDGRGRGNIVRRRFVIPRAGPLPGVRFPRRLQVTGRAVLDGRPTLARRSGKRLRYRWRIVRRPQGSGARIRGRARALTSFTPDRVGRYRIALRVSERGRRAKARSSELGERRASASASASTGYVFDIDGQKPVSAFGLPISTSTGAQPGVTIDGQAYPNPQGTGPGSAQQIQVLAIDRSTGEVLSNKAGNGDAVFALLAEQIEQKTYSRIVVVTASTSGEPMIDGSDLREMASLLERFGASPDSAAGAALNAVAGQAFTLIGVNGADEGNATVNVDAGADGQGSLSGRLRPTAYGASGAQLRFDQVDLQPFDTGAPGAGGNAGPTQLPALGPGAVAVTVLDAHSLRTVDSFQDASGSNDQPYADFLTKYARDPTKLVIVQFRTRSAFNCCHRQEHWDEAKAIAALGGNRDLYLRSYDYTCDPIACNPPWTPNQYTLIGRAGATALDGSPLRTVGRQQGRPVPVDDQRLQGYFVRDANGRFQPQASMDPAPGSDESGLPQDMFSIANSPPTPFTYPDDDSGWANAEGAMYDLLNAPPQPILCSQTTTCGWPRGIRINYDDPDFTSVPEQPAGTPTLSRILTRLGCAASVGDTPGPAETGYPFPAPSPSTFTQSQWDTLRQDICDELNQIEIISENLFAPLANLDEEEEVTATLDLFNARAELVGALDEEKAVQGLDRLDLAANIIAAASEVVGMAGVGGGDAGALADASSALLGVTSDALYIADDFARNDPVDEELGKAEQEAGQLASWIEEQTEEGSTRLADLKALVASDPKKLQAVYNRTVAADSSWFVSQQAVPVLVAQARVAGLKYMWPKLLGAASSYSCSLGPNNPDVTENDAGIDSGQPSNPMEYRAFTNIGGAQNPVQNSTLPRPFWAAHKAVNVSNDSDASLASYLFNSALDVPDIDEAGDAGQLGTIGMGGGASIVKSDLFMTGLTPRNNTDCAFLVDDL